VDAAFFCCFLFSFENAGVTYYRLKCSAFDLQVKRILWQGETINGIESSPAAGHSHTVSIKYNKRKEQYVIAKCDDGTHDGKGEKCEDAHPANPIVVPDM